MLGHTPKRPEGSGPQARFFQWVWDQLTSTQRIIEVAGQRTTRTTRGYFSVGGGKAGGGGAKIDWFKLTAVRGDYLVCHSWDGSTEGPDPIYVAKPYRLRESATPEDGYTYTFSDGPDALNRKRVKDTDPASAIETQYVTPMWNDGEEVWAIGPCVTGVVTASPDSPADEDVTLLLLADSRAWGQ